MLKKASIIILSVLLLTLTVGTFTSCKEDKDSETHEIGNSSFIIEKQSSGDFMANVETYKQNKDAKAPIPVSAKDIVVGKAYLFVGYTCAQTLDGSSLVFDNENNYLRITAEIDGEQVPTESVLETNSYYSEHKVNKGFTRFEEKYPKTDVMEFSVQPNSKNDFEDFYVFLEFSVNTEASLTFDYFVKADTSEGVSDPSYYGHSVTKINSYLEKKIQIDRFEAKYLDSTKYVNGRYQETDLEDHIDMKVGKEYFTVFSTAVTSLLEQSNNESFTLTFKISPLSNIIGTLDSANGGKLEEQVSESEKLISITFDVPEPEEGSKKYDFIIKLVPVSVGSPTLGIAFSADGLSFVGESEMTLSMTVNGEEKSSEGFEYKLSEDKTYYSVVGLGNTNYNSFAVPSQHEGLPVKRIEEGAFMDLSWIRTVEVSEGIEHIEQGAFSNCKGLSKVILPKSAVISEAAFSGCDSVTSITLNLGGKTLKSIFGSGIPDVLNSLRIISDSSLCDGAFDGCGKLKEIFLPNTVSEIGNRAFEGCELLSLLTLEEGNENFFTQSGILYKRSNLEILFAPGVFSGDLSYPDGITSVPGGDMSAVTGITVPEGVTSFTSKVTGLAPTEVRGPLFVFAEISSLEKLVRAEITEGNTLPSFSGAKKLVSIEFPSSVTYISNETFKDCNSLLSVSIPSGVTYIGEKAFYECNSLKEIILPDKVKSIGEMCFYNCTGLESIVLPKDLTEIPPYMLYGAQSLRSIEIPNSVKSVGEESFSLCKMLSEVRIPDGITKIPAGCFSVCESLYSVTLPNGIRDIESYAFSGCKSLEHITLPNSLLHIEYAAFRGSGLLNIDLPASVSTVRSDSFAGCESLEAFTVEEGNSVYFAYEGVLYSDWVNPNYIDQTKRTKIVKVPEGIKGTLKLCEELHSIKETDFDGCKKITELRVSGNIKVILPKAFIECDLLSRIVFVNRMNIMSYTTEGARFEYIGLDDPEQLAVKLKGEYSNLVLGDFRELAYVD